MVSFIITDTSMVAAALGLAIPDQGDLEAAIEAMVAHVNSRGGVAGHPIEPKIRVFNAITDSPISEAQLCSAVTQEDQAAVVMLTGQFQDNARPCYAAAGTLMFDMTILPVDRRGYDDLAPYLWSPIYPNYGDLMGALVDVLSSEGWLDGVTLGVIGIDSGINRRTNEAVLAPRLTEAGVEPAVMSWIDPTTSTSWNEGLEQAVEAFQSAGVEKVIVLGGSRLLPWLIDLEAARELAPAYALTTYDSPEYNTRLTPDQMIGSLGITVLPGWDVADDQYPSPANPAEDLCLTVLENAGLSFESRANSRSALLYCDGIRLLQQAGRNAASISPEDLSAAMWTIGDGFDSASVYSVAYEEGSYAGGAGYRVFAFDESCECMVIRSDTIPFRS